MEEALRETTQTLQALIHAAPVGITIVGQKGDVQLWNPAAERMFGWSKAEVLGEQLPWSRAEECGESASELSAVLQGQTHEVLPTRRLKKDGTLLDVNLSAAPLRNSEGTIFGAMSILADLTEQKRLEERLRQAQKMEAVGQLSGGIAHDFNNLLTVIIGYSEILLAQSAPGGQVHELQEQIHKAGERAAALTRQLLAFGRKQTLQVKILDINAVVQDMAKMLRRMIGEDIEMVIQPDPRLGHVKADLAQIEQILMNLASNARDAMPNGGTLTVRTANIELDESQSCLDSEIPPNSYVMLTVTDTGNGMTEATRQHVFEPFFTTKEVGKGTGLGLATVYGIVKQSNGHIEVDSEVGRGTTFRIYLPRLGEPTATSNDQPSPSGILRGKETVLLVEDEDAVRLLVTHALKSNGYNVLSASSGEEALKLCREHSEIALMVTDVIMPQMNGVQLAELATSFRENLKVLYMSGYTNNILENHGAFDSTTAFLPKPVSPRVLAKKVREVLDARPYEAAC
jgi:PAS domain S-box-containing protein